MTRPILFVPIIGVLATGCLAALAGAPQIERRLDRTFTVNSNSSVVVRISGGPIVVETGPGTTMSLRLDQTVNVASEARADEVLKEHEISVVEQAGVITLTARRHRDDNRRYRRNDPHVRFSATLTVPANVRLDLDTSGGPITVRGERTADVKADTSGGPITVDGGRGALDLDTSGGPIRVGRALGNLRADTSGGGITVDYVGPSATDVSLDTSGGTIRVGVDRQAKFDLSASTSGGNVRVEGLSFESQTLRRSRAVGRINGGGGRLHADTSGGSIEIRGAER